MTTTALAHPQLAETLWNADSFGARAVRNATLAIAGSLLLTLSAKVAIPFYPVPITMQTFAVLVIGMAYGWKLGGATVLLYLAQGAAGLPVFAGGGGIAYMAGTTGGYLVGFLLSAVTCGWLAERGWDRRRGTTLLAMTLGTAIILLSGVAWLAALTNVETALGAGLLTVLPGAALKIALATMALPFVWERLGRAGDAGAR